MECEPQGFTWRRYLPMGAVQFTSVFIDYAFKSLAALSALTLIGGGYANSSAFIALLSAAYTLPFVIGGGLAGFAADRIVKRKLLIYVKVAELILLCFAALSLFYADTWGTAPLITSVFLLSLQSMFLSPGFNGLIPEIFGESGASQANGATGMISSVAVIFGGATGFILPTLLNHSFAGSALFLFPVSVAGLICAIRIPHGVAADPQRRLKWDWITRQFADAWSLRKDKPLFLAICGDAFFCALSTVVLSILLVFMINTLHVSPNEELSLGLTQLMLGIGVGLGSLFAGRLSGRNIEIGIAPFGVFGMMLFLLLIPLIPGNMMIMGNLKFFPFLSLWLFGLGFSGGVFIVPLRAFVQCRAERTQCGTVLAGANIIAFSAMLISAMTIFYLTAGIPETDPGLWTGTMAWIQRHCLTWNTEPVFYLLAFSSLMTALIALTRMPGMAVRCVALLISRVFYRVKLCRKGRIPNSGPVLLVANHVTLIDGLLLSMATQRPIRFMMHEEFYRQRWIYPLAKLGNFIEIPKDSTSEAGYERLYKTVKECLDREEVICIFPENKLIRTGVMNVFRVGYHSLVRDYGTVPVVPVSLSFPWGSLFSRYYGDGRVTLNMPRKLPYPASVIFGKAIPANSVTPFALQRIIGELGAEMYNRPRRKERPIHYRFSKVASRHPFRNIITESSGKSICNYQFWVGSALLSREIRRKTDNPYVAVMLPNCIGGAVSIMATLMADKIPAILNFTASRESLMMALEKTGHPMIITSRLFLSKINFEPMENMWFLEDVMHVIPKWKKMVFAIATFCIPYPMLMRWISPVSHRDVKRAAVVLFSSGSSGLPKAVVLSHHNLNEDVNAMLCTMGWRDTDKMTGSLPMFHSYGFTTGFWLPLMTLSPVGYIHSPLDAAGVGDVVESQKLTILLATPTFLQNYIRKIKPEKLKTIRLFIVGGEKMRMDIAEKCKEKFGILPIEGYGATELSPVAAVNISQLDFPDLTASPGKPGSIGRALPNFCAKVVNPETMEPLEEDQEGLLFFKSSSVMMGYLDDPEQTEKVIIDGWYNTGDLAKIDIDGYIFITGRLSRFSKIGGEMVPHERIEQVLLPLDNELERAVAVTGVPDPQRGERLIILYGKSYPATPEIMLQSLKDAGLPNLWIPKIADIFAVEKVPILGSGKLDLTALNHLARQMSDTPDPS